MFQNIIQIVKNELFILIIPSGNGWYYLAVKELSALLRGTTSKHHTDFYWLDCLCSIATKNKIESHKKVYENKTVCNVVMPSEDIKISEFNQFQKIL